MDKETIDLEQLASKEKHEWIHKVDEEEPKGPAAAVLLHLLLLLSVLMGAFIARGLVLNHLLISAEVHGVSMEDTMKDGALTVSITPFLKSIERGDLVSFREELLGEESLLLKRVVGMPGEEIIIRREEVYINEGLLKEPYATYRWPSVDYVKILLQDDEYFLMGDNRSNSTDSRRLGPVKKEKIIGIQILMKEPKKKPLRQ